MWRDKDDRSKWAVEGTAIVEWLGRRDDLSLTFRAKYEVQDDRRTENSRLARVRWYHDWTEHVFTLLETDFERDEVEVLEQDEDYRLMQGIVGVGVRNAWSRRTWVRMSGAWHEAWLDLLRIDRGRRIEAPSLLLESQVGLADRVTLTQWTWWIFWRSFDSGIDSEIELIFRIVGGLDLGLRHIYRDNAATLTTRHENEIKLFTRFTF